MLALTSPYRLILVDLILLLYLANGQETRHAIWLDPRCSQKLVIAFNEARFVAAQLRTAYREDPVKPWLDDAIKLWFWFDTTSEYLWAMDRTFERIASLRRVNKITEAHIHIYCDNQEGPGWKVHDGTSMEHEPTGMVLPNQQLACRRPNVRATTAHESREIAKRRLGKIATNGQADSGDVSTDERRIAIYMCNKGMEVEQVTIQDVFDKVKADETAFGTTVPVTLAAKSIMRLLFHELCHVRPLSELGSPFGDRPNYDAGVDWHKYINEKGEVKQVSGYFRPEKKDGGIVKACGRKLQNPLFTLMNPDSYAYLAQSFWMHLLGRSTWEAGDYKVWFLPETGELPPVPTWPTDQAPDWTNKVTPMDELPDVLRAKVQDLP